MKRTAGALITATALCVLLSCSPDSHRAQQAEAEAAGREEEDNVMIDSSYVASVEAWGARRVDSLKAPDSWLTLVGLDWLPEGEQTFGTDSGNDIVLTKGQPRAGVLRRTGDQVRIEVAKGVDMFSAGEPLETMELETDALGSPTEVEYGDLTFYLIRRGERIGMRIKDRRSPTLQAFDGLDLYPIDSKWAIEGRLEASSGEVRIAVPNVLGTVDDEVSPGKVRFEIDGHELSLDALEGGDETELFLVFGDLTNGKETYGGGRFLYATVAGDRVTLDFNRAYNPPCVFTAYATCPLPPPQNRLPIAVAAGEKRFASVAH